MPARPAGLGIGLSTMAAVGERGDNFRSARRSLHLLSHYPLPWLEGFPLWGFGPSSPSQFLALFIDWKLTYNLIFYLLISPTAAASCQRGDRGINGNLVGAGEGPGRGRPLTDRSPASSWQQDSSRSMREAASCRFYRFYVQLTILHGFHM